MENNNIFSLFDLIDTDEKARQAQLEEEKAKKEAEQKKELEKKLAKAKETKASDTNSSDKKKSAPKVESFNVNENTIIRYYGEEYEITAYFTTEELAEGVLKKAKKEEEATRVKITAEHVRQRLEKDFPELVKDYTEIVYIENKNILVPIMKAKKKGNIEMDEVLPSYDEGTSFRFEKIPFDIFAQFVALAKMFAKSELEVHGDIYYNFTSRNFILDIPQQTVHKFWVNPMENELKTLDRVGIDVKKVCEIHSHHFLRAIPSKQDDSSERIPGMFYVIVGNLANGWPQVHVRAFVNDEVGWAIKKFDDIFVSPFTHIPTFDIDNIKIILED